MITQTEVNAVFDEQVKLCADTLQKKTKEYTGDDTDRLGAFSSLMKPKAKPKKPKAPKKASSAAVPEDPFGDVPEDLPELFPPEEGCTIVMTDKKSIMS